MKGLLIKDLCLLKAQKRFFLVLAVMAFLIAFSMQDVVFIVGYITFILPMFSLSTISYDEFDNGNPFLFTLPITRTTYVLEKYLFSFLTGSISAACSILLGCIVGGIMGNIPIKELLIAAPVMLGFMLLLHSVLLPINIKFGAEKARTAMLLVGGGIALLGVFVFKILQLCNVNVMPMVQVFLALPVIAIVGICAGVLVIVLLVSVRISISIINKKQF